MRGPDPLTIGGIQLEDFNTPESLILGSTLLHSLQEFQDGKRVAQTFGFTPPKMIPIKGKWLNQDAFQRSAQLEKFAKTGKKVNLIWGPVNMPGFVAKYHADWGNKFRADYELEFIPLGLAAGSSVGPGTSSAQNAVGSALGQIGGLIGQ